MDNAVVIVTYNRINLLKECLQCIMCQDLPFKKAIVVDNASDDGTAEFIQGLKQLWMSNPAAPELIVLRQEKNLGGAGGFYVGLEEAKKHNLDYVLIIDDDAMITSDYMLRITECAKDNPGVYAFAGRVETDGIIDVTHRRNISSKLLFAEESVDVARYEYLSLKDNFRCDCATFCGLVVRGEALERFGLPKQEYFIWYDDTEYCLRFKDDGGVLVIPSALLNHKTKVAYREQTLLMRTSWRHYYGYRNRLDCGRKHFGSGCRDIILLEYRVLSLLSRVLLLSRDEEKRLKGRFNIQMIRDVIDDHKKGIFGVREEYHP